MQANLCSTKSKIYKRRKNQRNGRKGNTIIYHNEKMGVFLNSLLPSHTFSIWRRKGKREERKDKNTWQTTVMGDDNHG